VHYYIYTWILLSSICNKTAVVQRVRLKLVEHAPCQLRVFLVGAAVDGRWLVARSRVARGEDDGDTLGGKLCEVGIDVVDIGVLAADRRQVALYTVGHRVDMGRVGGGEDVGGPDLEIAAEVVGEEGMRERV
jgi:hypothetical protein